MGCHAEALKRAGRKTETLLLLEFVFLRVSAPSRELLFWGLRATADMKLQHGRRIRSRNKKGVAIELLQTATPVFPPEHKAISTGRIELRKRLDFFERTAASGTLLRRVRFSARVNTNNF